MNDKEKTVQNQGKEYNQAEPGWGPIRWAACRPEIGNGDAGCCCGREMPRAMARCFRSCRDFFLVAAILAAIFLILAYYLYVVPEVIQAW